MKKLFRYLILFTLLINMAGYGFPRIKINSTFKSFNKGIKNTNIASDLNKSTPRNKFNLKKKRCKVNKKPDIDDLSLLLRLGGNPNMLVTIKAFESSLKPNQVNDFRNNVAIGTSLVTLGALGAFLGYEGYYEVYEKFFKKK